MAAPLAAGRPRRTADLPGDARRVPESWLTLMPGSEVAGTRPAPVFRTEKRDGWGVRWLEDDLDYRAVLEDFRRGRLQGEVLASRPTLETFRVRVGERTLIVKHSTAPGGKPGWHLWEMIAGPAFSRLFRETWAAIGRGCGMIPEIYLAAEKCAVGRRCLEGYLIAQYLEGETLRPGQPRDEWLAALGPTVARLHGYGLASGAPHAWNLIRTGEGWKMIDLSFQGPMLLCQAYDIHNMKRRLGVEAPIHSPALKFAHALVQAQYRWHLWRRAFRERRRGR